MEGRHMRQVVKRFDEKKRLFSNKASEIHLDLPIPLNTLNMTGRITQGELKITQYVATCGLLQVGCFADTVQ